MGIKLIDKFTKKSINEHEVAYLSNFIPVIHEMLQNGTGPGNDFTGWINLPVAYDKDEFARIKMAANKINEMAEVLVVIGIGGSYLGARSVIESLTNPFDSGKTKIIFAGHQMSGTYMHDLIAFLSDKDWAINVISKSGTTTEPALAFRILRKELEQKYGAEQAKDRIFATTDAVKGALKSVSIEEGFETFVIPDDVGGRFSVLTAVGLLPIAVAGIDIDQLMAGAAAGRKTFTTANITDNIAYQYAILRNCLYNKGYTIEMLVGYEPALQYFTEWWKQLFGESEGKDHKGIFPTGAQFSTDLHSLGQYIQDGRRDLFETVIAIQTPRDDIELTKDPVDLDGLNFMAGKTMNYANNMAMQGTLLAHSDGDVPNILIEIEKLDAFNLGEVIYFFEMACAVSGYLLGVNPFDQDGVEAYKKNMFALLGKPGFESLRETLVKRLK